LPLPEAVSILIGQKHKEIRDLKEKTGKLLEEYENKIREQTDVCDNEFILVPKGKTSINKEMTAILSAQESIKCIASFKKFSQTFLVASEEIIKAANRGVKIRFILDKSSMKTLLKILPELDNASCQIKCFEELPVSFLAVYDGCEAQMATSSDGHFSQAPMLWSNNPMLLRVFQNYFESLWCSKPEKAFEEEHANFTS
jgi:sugar-specific transcriptional regulator TrmB